jgi:hypothetical protein
MILGATGVDLSPIQLSEALRDLNVSHTVTGYAGFRMVTTHVYGTAKEQPAWPVIVDGVRSINRIPTVLGPQFMEKYPRLIYFVTDARAAIASTNLGHNLWEDYRNDLGLTFTKALKDFLWSSVESNKEWKLEVTEPSVLDYVRIASKPSFLNDVQTTIYKITPYALRKEVQSMCISYLAGGTGQHLLKHKLKSSFKLAGLLDLMSSPKAKELREAVGLLKKNTVDEVVASTGFQSFELLYVTRSYDKERKAQDKPVAKAKRNN